MRGSADFLVLFFVEKVTKLSPHFQTIRFTRTQRQSGREQASRARAEFPGVAIGDWPAEFSVKIATLKQRARGCSVEKKWMAQGEREREREREREKDGNRNGRAEREFTERRKVELNAAKLQRPSEAGGHGWWSQKKRTCRAALSTSHHSNLPISPSFSRVMNYNGAQQSAYPHPVTCDMRISSSSVLDYFHFSAALCFHSATGFADYMLR